MRLVDADCARTKLPDNANDYGSDNQNDLRVAFGFAWHVGER